MFLWYMKIVIRECTISLDVVVFGSPVIAFLLKKQNKYSCDQNKAI